MEKTYTPPIGCYAPDFELPGIDDQVHHLARYLDNFQAVGVVFMGNFCPDVRLYLKRLKQIQTDFEQQRFTLIGINANDAQQIPEDSFDAMKSFAAQENLNFPYLRDHNQDVAKCFRAKIIPEAFLIDNKAILCYRGRIDDCADSPDSVQTPYLRNSIAALLNGQPVATNVTEAVGCNLKWRTKPRYLE
ncbi:MAG: thioredoxin family protein [Moorea sp. SIO2B7]|nr:thioredoxin family protein [Moorena sp. SIO2B7]